jgi:hypothetical protein
VNRLLKVINDTDFPGIVIGIHMDEFRKAMAGRDDLRESLGEPYTACFQWVARLLDLPRHHRPRVVRSA